MNQDKIFLCTQPATGKGGLGLRSVALSGLDVAFLQHIRFIQIAINAISIKASSYVVKLYPI